MGQLLQQSAGKYSLLAGSGRGDRNTIQKSDTRLVTKRDRVIALICILNLILGFLGGFFISNNSLSMNKAALISEDQTVCKDPAIRREWRTLSVLQNRDYIQAVQCLSTTHSTLGLNQTIHDDFPWVHSHIGNYCMPILGFQLTDYADFKATWSS